jgi:hypothetical protein
VTISFSEAARFQANPIALLEMPSNPSWGIPASGGYTRRMNQVSKRSQAGDRSIRKKPTYTNTSNPQNVVTKRKFELASRKVPVTVDDATIRNQLRVTQQMYNYQQAAYCYGIESAAHVKAQLLRHYYPTYSEYAYDLMIDAVKVLGTAMVDYVMAMFPPADWLKAMISWARTDKPSELIQLAGWKAAAGTIGSALGHGALTLFGLGSASVATGGAAIPALLIFYSAKGGISFLASKVAKYAFDMTCLALMLQPVVKAFKRVGLNDWEEVEQKGMMTKGWQKLLKLKRQLFGRALFGSAPPKPVSQLPKQGLQFGKIYSSARYGQRRGGFRKD